MKLETFCHKDGSHFSVECQVMPLIEQGKSQGAVITFSDITERLKTEQELQHKASFDGLTGIYNRLKFEELLEHALSEAKRYKRPVSLAMFDIDHFKLINDAHGHLVGDAVLKEVTALTQLCLREVDSLARWGGEEFMILAPETTLDGVTKIAEKIRNTIACYKFSGVGQVTVSFGIAQIENSETEDALLKRVDDALYIAKQLGRNRVEQAK
ncbi:MAG: sensor domain-containing diguanylate cyclase [Candidatus Polarisedimenticolaceae bacterium]|nr:sensor domain-containing diguanylate cyclase [Candidatus Polarisedimenticolaceae bacterium]